MLGIKRQLIIIIIIIIMKYKTPKTWLAALIGSAFKYYIYRFLFINVSLDKMYPIRPLIIMYTFLQPD